MDIKELLKKYGTEIPDDKFENFNSEFRKTYKHHSELDTAQAQLTGLQTQLNDANKQIESFKSMDIESIKKSAEEYKARAEKAEKEAKDSVARIKRDYAINDALNKAKAKNTKAVRALLNLDSVTLSDDGLVGLSEQLEKVKSENGYLFDDNPNDGGKKPRVVAPTPGAKDIPGDDKAQHAKANDAVRRFFNKGEN